MYVCVCVRVRVCVRFVSDISPAGDMRHSRLHVASAGSQAQTSVLLREAHTQQLGHFLWVQTQLIVEFLRLPERKRDSVWHSFSEINSYLTC